MKKKYYVSDKAQDNGDHEVHDEKCKWLPNPQNSKYLGEHESCYAGVLAAKSHYYQVNGCVHCCKPCHTS
jgi:hypothetical protein